MSKKIIGVTVGTTRNPKRIVSDVLKNLPPSGGGVTSWNDLTDKPFGSTFGIVELASATSAVTYDAETTECSCSVSLDFTPISGQRYKLVATDGTQTLEAEHVCNIMSVPASAMYIVQIGVTIDDSPIFMIKMSEISPWNVYFKATSEEGATWTITVYEYSEIVTPLDGKYLPDGIPFVEIASVGQGIVVKAVNNGKPTEFEAVNLVKSYNDLTDVPVGEKITTIIGERTTPPTMFDSVSLGNYNLTGCNLVCFDGVEYEVPLTNNGMERLYGNPALRSAMFPSNGMPFVLVNNQVNNAVSLYVTEMGTHTISVHKRELVFLSDKYLPDSVVLESELEAKGYQTEEQVTALINNALGVIENGTY